MNKGLMEDVSKSEILACVSFVQRGKSPDLDGFTVEFLYWAL